MADMTLYEDRNYYYVRIKDYDKMDADAQVTIPFDEELSVLVGLLEEDESHRIHYIGANLSKEGFTSEEAENFIEAYDFRFFTKEEEEIIVPPIEACVELSADYDMEGYLIMLIQLEPPCASIRDQLIAMQDLMDEEELMMEMEDDFPFELPYKMPEMEYDLPENRDKSLLEIFLDFADESASPEQVIEALKVLEPHAQEDGKSPDLPKYMEEYAEFYEFFMDCFSETEELIPMMEEIWGEAPLVLQIGSYMYERSCIESSLQQEKYLGEKEKESLEKLLDYIRQRDTFREITVYLENSEVYSMAIEGGMAEEDLEERMTFLKAYFIELLLGIGVLLVEFYDDQIEKVIVNGFFCNNGKIKKMGPSDLMEALDLQTGWEDRFQLQIAFLDI